MKIDEKDLVTATELARNTASLLANAGNGRRYVIIHRNSPTAALIGMDDLRLLERLTEQASTEPPPQSRVTRTPVDPAAEYLAALGISNVESWTPRDTWTRTATAALQIPVGLSPDGTPVTVTPGDIHDGGDGCLGLIQGVAGSGKSTALASMVLSLCALNAPDRVAFVLAHRFPTFRGFEALPHVQRVFDTRDPNVKGELVTHLKATIAERLELIHNSEWPARDLTEASTSAPTLFVVIDDSETVRGTSSALTACLDDLVRDGRALGINLLIASQRYGGVWSPAFRESASYRITLATNDAADSREFINTDQAKFLPVGNGAAIINKPTANATSSRFEFFNAMAADSTGTKVSQALISKIAATDDSDA